MKIRKGTLRRLTGPERLSLGTSSRYVTTTDFSYRDGDIHIIIPKGFLTDYNSLLLFYDYLYTTHRINERCCTRTQADKIIERVLREEINLYYWLFIGLMKFNLFWSFEKSWKEKARQGPKMISYELKKSL